MAVTVTDNRTIFNEADATTGWSGTASLFTTDPAPVEATGCLGYIVSTATVDAYFTGTAVNLSNKLVYAWTLPRGAMDTVANGGVSIILGDGTNRVAFHLAGSDLAGFRHDDGPVFWQCHVLDTSNLPAARTVRAGTFAALNFAAITQIGVTFKTLAKALANLPNCFVDIVRYGDPTLNSGAMLNITGGTSVAPGKFSEIAAADRTTTNQQAFGVVRQLGSTAYGLQGALRFGNATGTASSWFEESNITVLFESRGLATTRYGIYLADNGVGTTTWKLGTKVGTGTAATGSNGCSFVCPAGVGAVFDAATDTDVTDVFIYGSTFSGFNNGFKMRTGQEFIGSRLIASGTFETNGATIVNSEITSSTATTALIVNSVAEMNAIANSSFTGNNRAISITAPGTYTFDNLQFSGNTYDIENTSGGAVVINATNGSNVSTFINTAGGSVTINNAKTFTISNITNNTEIRIFRISDLAELAGAENVGSSPSGLNNITVASDPINAGRYTATYSYNYVGDIPIYVVAMSLQYQWLRQTTALTSTSTTFQISQIIDRQYSNN
jgi:hypothetical protein